MIVNSDQNAMVYSQDPPSYDAAIGQGHAYAGPSSYSQPHSQTSEGLDKRNDKQDVKQPAQPKSPRPAPSMNMPTVYNYVHPVTQQHIASLLPPNHPEMICLQQGAHIPQTRYGLLGVLAAVFWFPLGVGLCLLDRKTKCKRCGHMIDNGLF